METANGNHFITTQYVRAAHGKAEKEWPFISCSNSAFTEVCTNFIFFSCSKKSDIVRVNGTATKSLVLLMGLLFQQSQSS